MYAIFGRKPVRFPTVELLSLLYKTVITDMIELRSLYSDSWTCLYHQVGHVLSGRQKDRVSKWYYCWYCCSKDNQIAFHCPWSLLLATHLATYSDHRGNSNEDIKIYYFVIHSQCCLE